MKKCFLCKSKMELVPLNAEFQRVLNDKKIIDTETPFNKIEWIIACTNCSYAERYNRNVKENVAVS